MLECSLGLAASARLIDAFERPSGDAGEIERSWRQAIESLQPSEFRARARFAGAASRPALCRVFPERGPDGSIVGAVALMRFEDGGEARPAAQPGAGADLLAQALEASPAATAVLDDSGKTLWANDAFGFLFGLGRGEVAGRRAQTLIAASEGDAALSEHFARGSAFATERVGRHACGYEFRMRLEARPLPAVAGEGARFVAHFSNIDHLPRADLGLARNRPAPEPVSASRSATMPELRAALAALRREIEEIRRESASKTEFLANISHEIRTPMNAVVGFCDLLLASEMSDEQGEYVQAIYHSGQLLIQLIGQVLDYSKIASGHLELLQEHVDLHQVFLEVQSFMGTRARSKGLRFDVDFEGMEHGFVIGDATRIKQVVVNLLGNAYKFTRKGGISLSARSEPSVKDGQARIEVRVKDTGIGIDAKRIASLFSPFAQGDAHASREYGGSGLGLAISKQLCIAMAGDVWLERTSPEGSVFCFEMNLPIVQRKAVPDPAKDERAPLPASGPGASRHRVLVVDDNSNNLLITSKLSEHLGYEAIGVSNGAEALDALRARDFSIVLMDVRMAPINGMETTRRIREGEAGASNANVYIIALTAHALQGDRDRCLRGGMNDYLSKPLTLEMLSEALRRAEHSLTA